MDFNYCVDDTGYEGTVETVWTEEDLEYVVQEAAEDFHANHDGWESSWPLQISILKDGEVWTSRKKGA